MTEDRDRRIPEGVLDCDPSRISSRVRARIFDSLLHTVAGVGLLFAADWIVLSGFLIDFISIGVAESDPPQLRAGIRTLAIPDSDLWATIFLLYWPVVFLVPILLYEIPLIALRGQTPGKMLNTARVVAIKDGNPPGWGRSSTRWAVLWLPLLIPFGVVLTLVVAASPLLAADRRGWHDRIAGTMVVASRPGEACAPSSGPVGNGLPRGRN